MVDVHSHILYDLDDGSSSVDESIELIRKMADTGFTDIILTPHYIEGSSYVSENKEKREKIAVLKERLAEEKIDVNLYLGNEIFINNNIINLIKEDKIYTLNKSKYILVEFPFHNPILNLEDIIYELKYVGLIPIIAHPERYTYFQDDYREVDRLREEGVLFQGNYSSILEGYGKESKKLIKYMLKKGYIDFLGTDIHHISKSFVLDNFDKIVKKIKKITREEYYKQIVDNSKKILANKDIRR